MTPAAFIFQNLGLGAGLAMDATAVSMSNGLNEPKMPIRKRILMAGMYALFQAAMPIAGYFAGYALIEYISPYIPWIALILLCFLGGKMVLDGVKEIKKKRNEQLEALDAAAAREERGDGRDESKSAAPAAIEEEKPKLTVRALLVQAIATSIDALSVGLSIASYTIPEALIGAAIIAAVTFAFCMVAVFIGQKFGDKLGSKAVILGGVILIAIGIEICLTGVLG